MNTYCTNCGDQYDPAEYAPAPVDPDEPRFCSDECGDRYNDSAEFEDLYREVMNGGAPVF
jgi:hypothetical protein